MVPTVERLTQQTRRVVPNRRFDDPRALDDPVDDLEPAVAERVVAVDEAVEERTGRDGVVGREVEDRAVVFAPRDLEIDGQDK